MAMTAFFGTSAAIRRVEPVADGWRSVVWRGGAFDTARRMSTSCVEGTIRTPRHMVLVTLRGRAERLQVRTACGHRYDGPDEGGAVSIVPAHCERWLQLRHVRAEWASLALDPELCGGFDIAPRTNMQDPVLAGLAAEMLRLLDADGTLDPLYGESVGVACAHYLARRFGQRRQAEARPMRLAPWQLARVSRHVEDHLTDGIRIADLAGAIGLSPGHFHRAFRATTGQTPLSFINAARVRRAAALLATETMTAAEVAARVGFVSTSHFVRVFRARTGVHPTRR
jgi:AraC family transcriptional regulator